MWAVETPVRYAERDGGVHIAYAVEGSGDQDLVIVGGWMWSITEQRTMPEGREFNDRLAGFARVIMYDQRGTGRSDPVAMDTMASLDQWLDDLVAVLDAAGSERATLYGFDAAGPLAILFAATHPERTDGLVLASTWARATRAEDYPIGIDPARGEELVDWSMSWFLGDRDERLARVFGLDRDPAEFIAAVRRSTSPGAVAAVTRMLLRTDVRALLSSIRVPTLIIHGADNRYIDVRHARYLAEHIPNATYLEYEGGHTIGQSPEALLGDIERFITGSEGSGSVDSRALATVLFTDIAGSTETNAAVGDHRWRTTLDEHDRRCRDAVERFRGRVVKHVGDGMLASFDGPGRAVRCAAAIVGEAERHGLVVRAGLHTGEVEVRRDGDIAGMTVNIAARISALAPDGSVLVSRTVADLVFGSGLAFEPAGEHELKGVPGSWALQRYSGS
jgi:class 3 adenylate cyclase